MKVASWNVNSLRVRQAHVLDWLDAHQPDVLGLQEIKMPTEEFPVDVFREVGYHAIADGQKTYNGVALLSRVEATDTVRGIPGLDDPQRRAIAGTFGDCRVINLYVPNGQAVGSDKYAYKLGWLEALGGWLQSELAAHERLVVMGDFNIAPDDRDVHDPVEWDGKILRSEGVSSGWDSRAAGFRRNRGLRIDLLLVSERVAQATTVSGIDREPRTLERPSDHAPVWIEYTD